MTPDTPPTGHLPLGSQYILSASGGDRERFLNGQLTNDVRKAVPGTCVYAAVLNAKGQLDAVCHVRAIDDLFLIDAPGELRDDLLARLDRYLIADDVELTDVSEQWHLTHVIGIADTDLAVAAAHRFPVNRFGTPGIDLLTSTPPSLDLPAMDPDAVEAHRIARGVPRWPNELQPGLLPPEAGLDETAISYDKGCYLGQEVISRMKRAGKTNRHLVQLRVPDGTPAGATLQHDGSAAGVVTSVSPVGTDGQRLALGYRTRRFEETGQFTLQTTDGTPLPGSAAVTQRLA